MKIKLTRRAIDRAAHPSSSGGWILWDTELRGFGLRVYPSGQKAFVVTYHIKGRQRFHTLGRYPELDLKAARVDALATLARIRKGADPSGEKIAARSAPTVTDLASRYMSEHSSIKKKPKSVKKDQQGWDRLILPRLGRLRVKDVSRADVSKIMIDMAGTPPLANKVLTLLSTAFKLAEIWGWRPEGTNPCRHLKRYKEKARERYLSESELSRLGDVLMEAEESWEVTPQAIAAVRLLIGDFAWALPANRPARTIATHMF